MSEMSDWNAIDGAIEKLARAIDIINGNVRGTADPLHDWHKQALHTLKEARAAYRRLCRR
jgi:hypothetical protein